MNDFHNLTIKEINELSKEDSLAFEKACLETEIKTLCNLNKEYKYVKGEERVKLRALLSLHEKRHPNGINGVPVLDINYA